jgi:hypothetical protein
MRDIADHRILLFSLPLSLILSIIRSVVQNGVLPGNEANIMLLSTIILDFFSFILQRLDYATGIMHGKDLIGKRLTVTNNL